MIDIKLLRQDPDVFIRAAELKSCRVDIPALLEIDRQLADITRRHQEARTAQNAAGNEIARLTGPDKDAAIRRMADSPSWMI